MPFVRRLSRPNQLAYLPKRGTATTALILLYLRVLRFLDSESGAVRLIAIDFAKAFDRLKLTILHVYETTISGKTNFMPYIARGNLRVMVRCAM